MTLLNEITFKPNLSFLSRDGKDKIHQSAMKILGDIGMKILHEETLALLKNAGCDVTEDGTVDISDLAIVASAFNTSPPAIPSADLNQDGIVDIYDLVIVSKNYGSSMP